MSNSDQREEIVFEAALQLQGAARAAYLDEACTGDAALRERIENLLGALERAGERLNKPVVPRDAALPLPPPQSGAKPGDMIGRYKLLQQIGEGGCGVVYMAEQEEPVRRRVALKVIKLGMDTKSVIARFEAERQALALMDHPNIAKVLDAGATDTGRPYFVMELVRGVRITEYCDEHNLPMPQRLELFMQVCQAVQHAHQKGIIHRDLKPSNILVSVNDGVPVPKVIDFGIAKATTGQPLTDKTLFTAFEQFIGTPAYMSPEQAVMTSLDIDTRTDIYSLGVLLYELLTGKTPFDTKELLQAGFDEMRRTIREDEPARPSTRLSTMVEDELTTTAKRRQTDAPKLIHLLRGDLDWIVMKTLEKDRARRYETANGLARDLERYLSHEPVVARPPSARYRFRKLVRRNWLAFAATGGVVAALLVGLAGSLWQWRRAEEHAASETSQRLRAEEAVTTLELQRAEGLLEKDEVVTGVACLARMVRQQPTNHLATRRLLSALIQRNFARPVGQSLRHDRRVWYAEFSPDGRCVVTASLDLTARVWDARTGEPATPPLAHAFAVRAAHFSPDGRRLVTLGDGPEARLWEVATGLAMGQPLLHTERIRTAHFSPDGTRILTASDDGTARVWDARTGRPALKPLRHQGRVLSARFGPDGHRIVTASEDKTAQVWDARTGEPLVQPFQHDSGVTKAEFSPNGQLVVTAANDSSVCVWDVSSGEKRINRLSPLQEINTVAFSPDGQRVLTASSAGLVGLWSARDWTSLAPLMRHRMSVWRAEFSPEGQRILTAPVGNSAHLWDGNTGEPLTAPLEHDDLILSARFSADGMFAVTASADKTARLWDVRLGAARSQRLPGFVEWSGVFSLGSDFSPDGEILASIEEAGRVRLWNTRTGQPGTILAEASTVLHLRWSPDGLRVAAFCADRTTRIWDVRTGATLIEPIRHGTHIMDLKFSPDGQWLATAGDDGNLHQWNARTGESRREPIPNRDKIEFFAYSPDGQRLLCTDFKDDQVRLHDAATGRLLAQTPPREGRIMHADFSPDGQRLVTASEDAVARIWRTDTLQPLTEPLRHKSSVLWSKFSGDGRRVVTASDDASARVWDVNTGQPVGEPMAHRHAVRSVEFSPDGRIVATACRDGTARLWDATTGRPVAEPFVHQGELASARFSPDGRRLLTVSFNDEMRAWDVPPMMSEAGVLLADLAEAVIGKRVNSQGALESVSPAGLAQVRQRIAELPRDADFTRWLEWFFADRSTRAISPNSPITVPEYVARRMEEKTLAAAREAVLLAPTNAPALAHLAEMLLASPGSSAPVAVSETDYLIRRAEALAPGDASVQESRKRITQEIERRSTGF